MLSKFTTEHGTLIIRTEDIRGIEDRNDGSTVLIWVIEGAVQVHTITGTAAENLARLQTEEFLLMEKAAQAQRRIDKGMPALPIVRGKPQ